MLRDTVHGVARKTKFVLELALLATVAGSFGMMFTALWDMAKYDWWRLHEEKSLARFDADFPDKVVLPNETSIAGRTKNLVGSLPSAEIAFVGFFPIALRYYLGKALFSYKAMCFAIMLQYVVLIIGYVICDNSHVINAHLLIALLFVVAALKYTLPPDSRVPVVIMSQLGILVMGTGFCVFLLPSFPMHNHGFQLAYFCLVLPLIREVSRFLATRSAWRLSFDANINGETTESHLHRSHAWVFVAWVQAFWTTYNRLAINNLPEIWMNLVVVMYQAVFEIAMRMTMKRRDQALISLKERCMSLFTGSNYFPRETKVIDVKMVSYARKIASDTSETVEQGPDAKEIFYSTIILSDTMAEYAGIITSAFLLAFWRRKPLVRPFIWYADRLDEDEYSTDYSWIISTTAIQYVMEIAVDVICFSTEKRNVDPQQVFKSIKSRSFAFLFMMATWFGSLSAQAFFTRGDSFSKCFGRDMCFCVENGLFEGGVREAYCMQIYPNATWDQKPWPDLGLHLTELKP